MIQRFEDVTSYLHMICTMEAGAGCLSCPKYRDAEQGHSERNCMLHRVRCARRSADLSAGTTQALRAAENLRGWDAASRELVATDPGPEHGRPHCNSSVEHGHEIGSDLCRLRRTLHSVLTYPASTLLLGQGVPACSPACVAAPAHASRSRLSRESDPRPGKLAGPTS